MKMSDWVNVGDRVPETGQVVLVYFPERSFMQVDIEEWIEFRETPLSWSSITIPTGEGWSESEFEDITHWMPLPSPPK